MLSGGSSIRFRADRALPPLPGKARDKCGRITDSYPNATVLPGPEKMAVSRSFQRQTVMIPRVKSGLNLKNIEDGPRFFM